MVLANEDDDAKVGREDIEDKQWTEHCPPGQKSEQALGDEFDCQQKSTDDYGDQEKENFKWCNVQKFRHLRPGVEHVDAKKDQFEYFNVQRFNENVQEFPKSSKGSNTRQVVGE